MQINLIDILLQIANFSLLLFILVKFMYQPILKMLDKRSKTVEEGMKAAESNLKKQRQLEENIEVELKKAREEGKKIKKDLEAEAQKEAEKIIEKAKTDAKKLSQKEREGIQASLEAEKKQMTSDFQSLILDTVSLVLEDGLSKTEHQKIVDAQIKKLQSVKFN